MLAAGSIVNLVGETAAMTSALTHNLPHRRHYARLQVKAARNQHCNITFLACQGAVSQVMTALSKVFFEVIAE
jgi:hypothetical protein